MNNENIDKIVDFLANVIKEISGKISNPGYHTLYFDIFMKELNAGNDKPYTDTFVDVVNDRLLQRGFNQDEINNEIEHFSIRWNAWVDCYQMLSDNGMIRR